MHKKLLSICLSLILVLSLLLATTGCGSPEADTENPTQTPITIVQNRVTALESRMTATEGKVANIPNVSQLRTDLDSHQRDINTLKSDYQLLIEENQGLQAQIDELEARLDALEEVQEEETSGDVDPEDAVDTNVKCPSLILTTVIEPDGLATFTAPIRLKLENQLSIGIEDIELSARVTARPDTGLSITSMELTGDIEWYPYGATDFESWDDIALKADERESYNLLLAVVVSNTTLDPLSGSVRLTVRVECEDYEVA